MKLHYTPKPIKLCLFLLLSYSLTAQNLITDGSFETNSECPTKLSGVERYMSHVTSPTSSSGDYFHSCGKADFSTLKNIRGTQEPAEGNAYIGLYVYALNNYREYVQLPTTQTLKEGYPYKLEFKVSLAETSALAIKNMTAVLGGGKLNKQNSSALSFEKMDLTADYDFHPLSLESNKSMADMENWITLTGEFVAKGYENHIIIGNFKNNAETKLLPLGNRASVSSGFSYYYIDDIRLTELPIKNYEEDKIYVLEQNPFTPKGYKLDGKAMAHVEEIFKYLKKNIDVQLKITGHDANSPTAEYSQFISSLRARAVALYLKKLGIDESRIVWQGMGATKPLPTRKLGQDPLATGRVEFVMTTPIQD